MAKRRKSVAAATAHGAAPRSASTALRTFWLVVRLARLRFLVYSAACHALGASFAHSAQGVPLDWRTAALLQAAVWSTHVFAHFVNEWADYEADKANANAGG